jgi:hypothetical protein
MCIAIRVLYSPFLPLGATMSLVPTAHICLVSFTDSEGIRHSVEVAASSLYEAAALAIGEFRRCGFMADAPGPATRLTVSVKAPATSHEVPVRKIDAWLQSGGRSPNEQPLKVRLRELLGVGERERAGRRSPGNLGGC